MNPFRWVREQARQAFLAGVQDGMVECLTGVGPEVPLTPPELADRLRSRALSAAPIEAVSAEESSLPSRRRSAK